MEIKVTQGSPTAVCEICGKIMNTGETKDEDCGGDCLECMANQAIQTRK